MPSTVTAVRKPADDACADVGVAAVAVVAGTSRAGSSRLRGSVA